MTEIENTDPLEQYHKLSPEAILNAFAESTGLIPTGRATALNSLENRVYEIEIETDDEFADSITRNRVAKFYRPGRWTREQILEEHEFYLDLVECEIPVVAPELFLDNTTLHKLKNSDIYYSVFPKKSGRNPDELDFSQAESVGRLIARIHAIGREKKAKHRLQLNPEVYGRKNLKYLLENDLLPPEVKTNYVQVVNQICDISEPWFESSRFQRIHGDCHLGNLINRDGQLFWVDFDDMLNGPCIQDLWLIVPGRDDHAKQLWFAMLEGYESFCDFDYNSMRLIEPLRALRYIHFSAWIAKRYHEPAFMRAFPNFNHPHYWQGQLIDLQHQLDLITNQSE